MPGLEIINAAVAHRDEALEVFVQERPRRGIEQLRRERSAAWTRALDLNPHTGPSNPPRVWLARIDGLAAGVLLGVPFRARLGVRTFAGHWGVDLYVPPSRRGHGIGAALLARWRDESPLALGLGITDSAYRIELGLGWRDVPLPPRLVCPLTARGALALRCSPARIPKASQTRSDGFGTLLGPTSIRSDAIRTRIESTSTRSGPFRTHSASTPDPRAGGLWERLRLDLPAHIERDAAMLEERYHGPGWTWVSLERAGRLEGLVVCRAESRPLRRKLWIYEYLVDMADAEAGQALAGALLEAARTLGADVVEGRITAGAWRRSLEREGFFPGRTVDRFIVHAGSGTAGEDLHRVEWALTLGDSGNR